MRARLQWIWGAEGFGARCLVRRRWCGCLSVKQCEDPRCRGEGVSLKSGREEWRRKERLLDVRLTVCQDMWTSMVCERTSDFGHSFNFGGYLKFLLAFVCCVYFSLTSTVSLRASPTPASLSCTIHAFFPICHPTHVPRHAFPTTHPHTHQQPTIRAQSRPHCSPPFPSTDPSSTRSSCPAFCTFTPPYPYTIRLLPAAGTLLPPKPPWPTPGIEDNFIPPQDSRTHTVSSIAPFYTATINQRRNKPQRNSTPQSLGSSFTSPTGSSNRTQSSTLRRHSNASVSQRKSSITGSLARTLFGGLLLRGSESSSVWRNYQSPMKRFGGDRVWGGREIPTRWGGVTVYSEGPRPEMVEGISKTETGNRNVMPVPRAMSANLPMFVQFKVSDLNKTCTFYENILGMKVLHYQDMPTLNRSRVLLGYDSDIPGFPNSQTMFLSLIKEYNTTKVKRGVHSFLGIGVTLPNITHVNIRGLVKFFGGYLHDKAQLRRITPSMIPDQYARDIVNWTNAFIFDPDGYGIELVQFRNATDILKHVPWQQSSAHELSADAVLQRATFPPPKPSQKPDMDRIYGFLDSGGVNMTLNAHGEEDRDRESLLQKVDLDVEADDGDEEGQDEFGLDELDGRDTEEEEALAAQFGDTTTTLEVQKEEYERHRQVELKAQRVLKEAFDASDDETDRLRERFPEDAAAAQEAQAEMEARSTATRGEKKATEEEDTTHDRLVAPPFQGPQYLHRIRIYSTNLKKATSFYENALGMRTVRYRSHLKEYTYPFHIYPALSRYYGYGSNYDIFNTTHKPSAQVRNGTEVFQPMLQVTYAYEEDKILRGDDLEYLCTYTPNIKAAIKHAQSIGYQVYPVQIIRFRKRDEILDNRTHLPSLESVTFRVMLDAKPLTNISDTAFTRTENGTLVRRPNPPRWEPPTVNTCFGIVRPNPDSDYDSNSDEEDCQRSIRGYRSGMDKHIEDQVIEAGAPGSKQRQNQNVEGIYATAVGGSVAGGEDESESVRGMFTGKGSHWGAAEHSDEAQIEEDPPGVIGAVAVFDTNRFATVLTNLKPQFRKLRARPEI
eukprot:GHVQ01012446.1.p1 GENE.GHVQ01012446.1~~GHVQ01012446.1.p1  ORF type:complete len:1060 (+),score=152.93 GHVQ01012446.1:450-3629(+)